MRTFILVIALLLVAGLLLVGAARALGLPFPWIETPNTGGYNPNQPYATPPRVERGGLSPLEPRLAHRRSSIYLPVIRSPN